MPMSRFATNNLSRTWLRLPMLLVLSTGCGHGAQATSDATGSADAPDSSFDFETKTNVDVPIIKEDLGETPDTTTEVAVDTGPQTDVLAVTTQSQDAIKLGTTVTLKVVVDHNIGVDGAPKASEVVAFKVNGQTLELGVIIAASAKDQAPVSIWPGAEAGEYQVAGVRPGTAKLVATVDGIASPERAITVKWPDDAVISGATPMVSGSGAAKRVDEVAPSTVKVVAQTFAPGGVDATVRFPETAHAGDSFDLGTAPATGQLSISLSIIDSTSLGQPATPKAGRVWLDQTDKGYFRGTFLGKTLDQTPVVGCFVVERDGDFGVDVLDDPTLVEATSDTVDFLPDTDLHASRAYVNAIGNGKVMLTWRRIKSVTKAEIARWIIDAKTGATVTTLPPLVTGNVWPCSQPDLASDPVFGAVTAAVNNKKTLVAWEGKSGSGCSAALAPTGVWMRAMDSDGNLSSTGPFSAGAAAQVTDDACDGDCHPQLLALPNARFLVLWSPPAGGIRARRVEGDFTFTDTNPLQVANAPAIFASAAVLDASLGVIWRDPAKGAFMRAFTIISAPQPFQATIQEAGIGGPTTDGPVPGLGIFGVGSPGFLAFAIDGSPATNLKVRRYDTFSATFLGEILVDTGVDAVRVVSGQDPQIVALQRQADVKSPTVLRLRKFTTTNPIDGGTQLGPTVNLGAKSSVPLFPSVCYVPEVDVFVVAWSGDLKSEGVYFQRFR